MKPCKTDTLKRLYLVLTLCCILLLAPVTALLAQRAKSPVVKPAVTMSKERLLDKTKGGWAGQVIGCTYGGPTEFRYTGTLIHNYVPITWSDESIAWWYKNEPGLYDDVYMDLTFVDVFDRLGLDAPVDSFAMAFATAGYELWHANQGARYNILNGIMPPLSGHWKYNPHSEDIDYQIEADFSGLMSPGMPNAASAISDKIGHIMNYGDGWYGGVYVGAMYSLAFVSDDMEFVVSEALKTIPAQSRFYQAISDVIRWHKKYPNDWKQTWFECLRKWDEDFGCPHGTFRSYNIDAVINSAYVVIGLLYGEKDFFKTIDIATRCGQDSDCNPATAGGILATMLGYSKIPEKWMRALQPVEDMNFAYTKVSLNKVYKMSSEHALQMIRRNGGKVSPASVTIQYQKPVPVKLEQGFSGLKPAKNLPVRKEYRELEPVKFEAAGIVFRGDLQCTDKNYVAEVEMYIDGRMVEKARFPASMHGRRQELFWNYDLTQGSHTATFKWLNPRKDATINFGDALLYSKKQ